MLRTFASAAHDRRHSPPPPCQAAAQTPPPATWRRARATLACHKSQAERSAVAPADVRGVRVSHVWEQPPGDSPLDGSQPAALPGCVEAPPPDCCATAEVLSCSTLSHGAARAVHGLTAGASVRAAQVGGQSRRPFQSAAACRSSMAMAAGVHERVGTAPRLRCVTMQQGRAS